MSCLVENLIPTVSLGSSSVYNLRFEPSGFLPVPFLGSFFFFLPSCTTLLTYPKISSASSSVISFGNSGLNFSDDTLAAFLAAVPDAPLFVTVVPTLKLG